MQQFSFGNQINGDIPAIVNASEHHMALLFLLDTSGSMGATIMGTRTTPINELNNAMNRFKAEVCRDEHTKDILDVAVVEFNSEYRVVQEFSPIEYLNPVELEAYGMTYICKPLDVALDMVTDRSRFYRRSGAEPYKPWVVIITDGMAMDDDSAMQAMIRKANDMVDGEKVAIWSLVVGDAADDPAVLKMLHQFCGKRVLKLDGYDFAGFLDWANKSMRAVSQSAPGDKVKGQQLPDSVTIDIDSLM